MNDDAPVFSVANTGEVDLQFSDVDVVTFYNKPVGTITVQKTTYERVNNISTLTPLDDDGWRITVKSAACGIDQSALTGSDGTATFPNLPRCSDYVVSEDLSVSAAPGYTPASATSFSGITPSATINFVNERVSTVIGGCVTNCFTTELPTPTPTTPPATATAVPTETPLPATPTRVSTVVGERTPGPASPTPIAPSTGEGIFGGPVGGMNMLLVLVGMAVVALGLFVVGLGRRQPNR